MAKVRRVVESTGDNGGSYGKEDCFCKVPPDKKSLKRLASFVVGRRGCSRVIVLVATSELLLLLCLMMETVGDGTHAWQKATAEMSRAVFIALCTVATGIVILSGEDRNARG